MNEDEFRQRLSADGYAEPRLVEMSPNTFNDTHTHDFSAFLLLLDGEITVSTDEGRTVTCRPGDTFALPAHTPHTERVGSSGVRFLAGRR